MPLSDQRLIEAGFPCHQVGAETQREQSVGDQPPINKLHVWWARRPLVPSRAAILGSILPATTNLDYFLKHLGIEVFSVDLEDASWILDDVKLRDRVYERNGEFFLQVDDFVYRRWEKEAERRKLHKNILCELAVSDPELKDDSTFQRWNFECISLPSISLGEELKVQSKPGDPSWAQERIEFETKYGIRTQEDKYKYSRAYWHQNDPVYKNYTIIDPTSGGGSIPFEALRLGCNVIANELNPVASVILKSTLEYPVFYGLGLEKDLKYWSNRVYEILSERIGQFFPTSFVPSELLNLPNGLTETERNTLKKEKLDGFIYCRQVVCPNCGGDAPLLNSFWLIKKGEKWGVSVDPQSDKSVQFKSYRVVSGTKGPNGESLDDGTVTRGVGQCVHCQQAIDGKEIKRQAKGASELGRWKDVLYSVAAIKIEPQSDSKGYALRVKSGPNAGKLKTKKVRYFRSVNDLDIEALNGAHDELEKRRLDFEMKGLIPNEDIPFGSKTSEPQRYGMEKWEDMFSSRQLLGHLTVMEAIHDLKSTILTQLGYERGKAVVTYLQFMLDKCTDYNSRQTRWEYTRGVIKGGFGRHDFSLKWTFGEMVYPDLSSGFNWGVSQVIEAYRDTAKLVSEVDYSDTGNGKLLLTCGSATELSGVENEIADAIVMDPPYYNNVQYSELSDFYYVWHKRSLADLYPGWFDGAVTDKDNEAVANASREGGELGAKKHYEKLMAAIFSECRRVLKKNGVMTLMFTHKNISAWETLTNSLIASGWNITACMPVESEGANSTHQKDIAAAASSIFITCRKTSRLGNSPSSWRYEVKGKLETAVRQGLVDFDLLKLNPVDRMIASWGRALRVYSEHWPVQDGDEEVLPTHAMQEAARVVAEEEVSRLSGGMVTVDDLDAETRLAVIALGINGLGDFPYDDALQMSRSLNFRLQLRNGNYRVNDEAVAYANEGGDQLAAPLAIKGNKLRLLKPEERSDVRLENPQTLWDVLNGVIVTYREGGIVAARNFLAEHGRTESPALRGLLKVWAKECRNDALRREAQLIDYEL